MSRRKADPVTDVFQRFMALDGTGRTEVMTLIRGYQWRDQLVVERTKAKLEKRGKTPATGQGDPQAS